MSGRRWVGAAAALALGFGAARAVAADSSGVRELPLAERVTAHERLAKDASARGDAVEAQRALARACQVALFVRFDPAEPLCARARAEARRLGRRDLEAMVSAAEGLFAAWSLSWDGAEAHARRARDEARGGAREDEPEGGAWRLAELTLGGAALYRGELDEATVAFRRLLVAARAAGDVVSEAEAHAWLCRAYTMTGRYPLAREACREAEAVSARTGDPNEQAIAAWSVGYLASEEARHGDASAAFERARGLAERVGNLFLAVTMRVNVVDELAVSGRQREAEAELAPLLALSAAGKLPGAWGFQLAYKQGDLAALAGDPRTAAERYAVGARSPTHFIGVRSLLGRAAALRALGDLEGARRAYVAAIERIERARTATSGDEQRTGYFELHAQAFRELVALTWDMQGAAGADAALGVAEAARARALLDALHAARARHEGVSPSSPSELRAALGPDERLLVYVSDAKALYGFALSRDAVRFARLDGAGTASELADRVAFFAALARESRDGAALAPAARRLYDDLIAPLLSGEAIAPRTLIVAPDGPLHRLPFDALEGPRGPLAASHALVLIPSGSVLTARAAHAHAPRALLGVADPVSPEPRASLPRAREEVRRAADAAGAPSAVLVGADASEARVKRELAEPARVLHFGTHGVIDEVVPGRSALVLGAAEGDDGLLRVDEILRLAPRAELVILSACRTGAGRVLGEGVMSVARAFLHAGADAVVASLWDVDDAETAALFDRFYAALGEGQTTVDALTTAKRSLRARGVPPRVWGAFVAIGRPGTRPDVPLRRPRDDRPVARGLGGLAVALLVAWRLVARSRGR